jgi:hypothetical protein
MSRSGIETRKNQVDHSHRHHLLTEWTQSIIDCHHNGFAVTSKDSAIECCTRARLISIAMNKEQHGKTFYAQREREMFNILLVKTRHWHHRMSLDED